MIWVTGVLRRTVVSDWCFDNLCRSHLQSQVTWPHPDDHSIKVYYFRVQTIFFLFIKCCKRNTIYLDKTGSNERFMAQSIMLTCASLIFFVWERRMRFFSQSKATQPRSFHGHSNATAVFIKIQAIYFWTPVRGYSHLCSSLAE